MALTAEAIRDALDPYTRPDEAKLVELVVTRYALGQVLAAAAEDQKGPTTTD
jgi:hypothetical protein